MKETNIESIHIEQNDDLIFMTVGKYKFFLAHRKEGGMEAKDLYEHLMFTARLQKTNSVKANNTYLMNGMGMSERKLKQAKAFLKKHGLIEYRQIRDPETGLMGETYIVVRVSGGVDFAPPAPVGSVSALADNRTCGSGRQMLEQGKKCLNKKVNASAHNDMRAYFESLNPDYYHNGRQAKAIKSLIDRALAAHKAHPDVFYADPLQTVQRRVAKLLMLKKSSSSFWQQQPVLPSTVLALWDNILSAAETEKPPERARSSVPLVGSPEWKAIYGDVYAPKHNS